MKKQLIALGAFLALAFGTLPGSAACHCKSACPCKISNPCCPAPVAKPCCPAPAATPCCPKVKPCCPNPCLEACPCPAAPVQEPCEKPSTSADPCD